VNLYFKHRDECDFERFNDNKLINRYFNVFNFLENVLNDELVDNRESNHRRIDLSNFSEDYVLSRDWNLRESHKLTNYFFWIFRVCDSYLSLMLICKLNTKYRFSKKSWWNQCWSKLSCWIFSSCVLNKLVHTWSKQTWFRVDQLISRRLDVWFSVIYNCSRSIYHMLECWHR
jgi:hypothetical protein